jgi:hypothetical protein
LPGLADCGKGDRCYGANFADLKLFVLWLIIVRANDGPKMASNIEEIKRLPAEKEKGD